MNPITQKNKTDEPPEDINSVELNYSLTLPGKIEISENLSLDGNRYKLHIYAGTKPTIEDIEKDGVLGKLLCKVISNKPSPVFSDGIASYFIVIRNGQEVAAIGNIGTSGCPIIVSNVNLVKGSFFYCT